MTRSLPTGMLALVVALLGAANTGLAEPMLTREEIDRLARPLIDGEWCPGFVVGIIDASGSRFFGYGKTSAANPKPPDADTVFEIGSVSKTFTGVLLAEMVGRGEVALDDPVQKHLPDAVKIPQVGDRPITLADLATHQSGLPRMPDNMKFADPANPYADYTVEQMYAFLSGCKPARKPGGGYEYSNLGMGLLGHVLALRAGKSYEDLLRERILEPLKMTDTRIALDDAAKARLAQGHNADGEPVNNWDIPTLAGAGAIRSTAADLLKWAAATMDPPKSPAGDAIRLARTPRGPDGDASAMGLGWHTGQKGSIVWHNGQTGGYHTFVGVRPEKRVAVVVLANNGSEHIDRLAGLIGKRLDGETVEPLRLRETVTLTPEQQDALVGRYVMPLQVLTVSREGDRLYGKLEGQDRYRVYAEDPEELFFKVVDARLRFKLNKKTGKAYMVTLHQGNLTLPGLRAEGEPTTKPATTKPAAKNQD